MWFCDREYSPAFAARTLQANQIQRGITVNQLDSTSMNCFCCAFAQMGNGEGQDASCVPHGTQLILNC